MRLYRPHIPLEVRCRVAARQLGRVWDDVIRHYTREVGRAYKVPFGFGVLLADYLLPALARLLNCEVSDLRLDHDPPLGARTFVIDKKHGFGRYYPDANDPEHLIYREKRAHDVKTRIRGEHGQYRDLALIKRARRKAKKDRRPKRRWPSRPLRSRKFSKNGTLALDIGTELGKILPMKGTTDDRP
jgi:hypothetical protein